MKTDPHQMSENKKCGIDAREKEGLRLKDLVIDKLIQGCSL